MYSYQLPAATSHAPKAPGFIPHHTSANDVMTTPNALPYVEPLDPHNEQHAISLLEEELARSSHVGNEQEHPSLNGRLFPASLSQGRRTFLEVNEAPLATAAYQALLERQSDASSPAVAWSLPDPFAASGGLDTKKAESQMISDLDTSIKSSKINFEHHRIRLINLDLHSLCSAPDQYQRYHAFLEQQYLIPQSKLLEAQRMKVDAINAQRMQEQDSTMRKMIGLKRKWAGLVEKNGRLDVAISRLEGEVLELERDVGPAVIGVSDGMEGGIRSKEH
ncbi:hypothetical protein HJC23_004766 [Cyclotella cryptica]|uniref:Pre-mRNA-splicing factor SPF27 n=1 Tax=Cyclotella cryptica TaxID=29204 RepID=A0ABD3PBW0_9STRA